MSKTAEKPDVPTAASTESSQTQQESSHQDFASQASEAPPGLIAEFVDFLLHNKKWWLTPIILVLFLLGLFVILGGSGAAAPFIYSLF
ncbi:MAG: hypothetical protein Tsb009_11310 [Planctomycetaceae bacterium]